MDNPAPFRRRLLPSRALLCCAAVLTVGAGPQLPPAGPAAYRQLVDDYRHQGATSLQRASALTEAEIRSFVDDVLNPAGESATWTGPDMLAAAMLHTDVCLWFLRSASETAAFAHLSCRHPADRSRGCPRPLVAGAREPLVPQRPRDAGQVGCAGVGSRPRQAFGTRAPVFGRARGVRARDWAWRSSRVRWMRVSRAYGFGMRLSTPLHAAAGFYEDALRRDGSLHEAALHLGRTRLMLGDLADARRWLEAATQSALASDRYLAFLYLGSMEEQDGRFDQAEARYRAAMSTFAWGQSGPLALARLLSRTNREAESRAVTKRMLEQRGLKADPLWTYLSSPGSEPGAVLHLIRAELWQ